MAKITRFPPMRRSSSRHGRLGWERWGEGGFLQRCVILPWLDAYSRVRNAGGEVSPAPRAAERLIGEIQSPEYVTARRLLSLFYYSLCYTS